MGCYSIADFRVVPALRADRHKMLLNLQEANIKEGIPIVASVEALVLLGTDEAPPPMRQPRLPYLTSLPLLHRPTRNTRRGLWS